MIVLDLQDLIPLFQQVIQGTFVTIINDDFKADMISESQVLIYLAYHSSHQITITLFVAFINNTR